MISLVYGGAESHGILHFGLTEYQVSLIIKSVLTQGMPLLRSSLEAAIENPVKPVQQTGYRSNTRHYNIQSAAGIFYLGKIAYESHKEVHF